MYDIGEGRERLSQISIHKTPHTHIPYGTQAFQISNEASSSISFITIKIVSSAVVFNG